MNSGGADGDLVEWVAYLKEIGIHDLDTTPRKVAPSGARAKALGAIRENLGECTRCKLHTGRNKIVFGVGNPDAKLMFVGEGPGAEEDARGEPFVGRAGKKLDEMITSIGLSPKNGSRPVTIS